MEGIKKLNQVHKILDFQVTNNPDNVSVSVDSVSYTNSDIFSKVLSLVGLLKENKVTSGDRIAYLAKNSSESFSWLGKRRFLLFNRDYC